MLHKQEVGRLHLIEVSCRFTSGENHAITALQIWQAMGGKRPPVLMKIERLLWNVILNSAQSTSGNTFAMLKTAFQEIDGLIGEGIDVTEMNWFDSGT